MASTQPSRELRMSEGQSSSQNGGVSVALGAMVVIVVAVVGGFVGAADCVCD
jgi:hypothetical protein